LLRHEYVSWRVYSAVCNALTDTLSKITRVSYCWC
jgi:hypothetical protein